MTVSVNKESDGTYTLKFDETTVLSGATVEECLKIVEAEMAKGLKKEK